MDFRAEYEKWCTDPYFDEATKAELKAIAGDDKEMTDSIAHLSLVQQVFVVS